MAVEKNPGIREVSGRSRDSKGRFVKGQSGNPEGRKKVPQDVQKMLKAAVPDMVRLLINFANDEEKKPDLRVECAKTIIERVYGKPKQAVDIDATNIPQVVFVGEADLLD